VIVRGLENAQPVPGMFEFSGLSECTHFYQTLQVSRGGGSGSVRDFQVILRTQTAFKPFKPLSKHACEHFLLSRIKLAPQAVIELGFFNEEIDESLRVALRLQYRLGEIDQPLGDLQMFVVGFEGLVVRRAIPADRMREGDQRRLAETLR
jgi:hypothetical protein